MRAINFQVKILQVSRDAVYFEVSSHHHPYSALHAMCSTRLDAAAIPYADDGAGGCNPL